MPVSIYNEKEADFSEHNYNMCWSLCILMWVNVSLQKQVRALPAIRPFSQQNMIALALQCHLLGEILLGNIINAAAPLREKPVWIHHTGPAPRCQELLSLTANIPFQSDLSLKGIIMGSHCAYPCLPTQGFLTSLAIFSYTQQMDLSHTFSSYTCATELGCR